MKKILSFVLRSLMVLFFIIPVVSCSSDNDEPKVPEIPTGEETRHIDGTIITIPGDESNYDGLYDFFNKELPFISVSDHDTAFLLGNSSDSCYFINSYEELRSIYTGKEKLPIIDFDSYTLIVGQKCSNNMYDSLDKQFFYEKDGKYNLDLFFSSEIVYPMVVYYNYWGLYPKLSKKEISINIISNK